MIAGPLLATWAQAPSPSPTDDELTLYTVTPGISGFIAFFVLAVVACVLVWSMVRHLRTVDRNAAPGDSGAERRQRRHDAARRLDQRARDQPASGQQASGQQAPGQSPGQQARHDLPGAGEAQPGPQADGAQQGSGSASTP